jgi:hypothetical protein
VTRKYVDDVYLQVQYLNSSIILLRIDAVDMISILLRIGAVLYISEMRMSNINICKGKSS